MKHDSFEDFLAMRGMDSGVGEGLPSDGLEDAIEDWISELGADELMEFAQDYGDWITEGYEKLAR